MNDEEFARRGRLLRSWGRSSSLFSDSEKIENRFNVKVDGIPYDAKFVFEELGYNLEPSEIGAAFGLVQVAKLEGNILARAANFKRHLEFFRNYEEWFIPPRQASQSRTGWLAFPLTIRDSAPFTRSELQIFLEKRNIQTRTIFTGNVIRQPLLSGVIVRKAPQGYPFSDAVMRGGMLLACHHGLSEEQIQHVHDSFREFAAKNGKMS